ncbi:MAG: nickel pincer cofactor biosynthesis protein LarB [Candidatus Heimdallarchaeota archaeon]|nr:nickel pincer cofactor biosynthesis protein LarB [Candidatus Heimdallarchaeota archaeon]
MRDLESILRDLEEGKISFDEAKLELRLFRLEFVEEEAQVDIARSVRKGIPEVIYAEKKPPNTVINIVNRVLTTEPAVLLSRVLSEHIEAIKNNLPIEKYDLHIAPKFEPYTVIIANKGHIFPMSEKKIGLLTAGTSDIPIAEEVKGISKLMGVSVVQFNDVGVAGVHRLFNPLKKMITEKVSAIVVIAGMEGALPTIVSGLVDIPVIGVPSSTGYGYGGKGVGALMTMLQSCSPGLVVVNIDNGINAGATAALIAKQSM